MVVDDAGGLDDVDVESSESAEVQALKTSNAATVTPTRNGGRVGPPNLIDHNRRLTGYPQNPLQPFQPYASKEARAARFRVVSHLLTHLRGSLLRLTRQACQEPCQKPSNRWRDRSGRNRNISAPERSRATLSAECQ
jgi:hypothetical protein